MNCADFEILLCDYTDGTLDAARRAELEDHQRECAVCAEFSRDVAGAVAFLERVPAVEPPHELLAKIAFEIPTEKGTKKGVKTWLAGWLQPIAQPRFAMGMAMTILSFSILSRFVPMQQLKAADLRPSEVWASLDDRAHRAYARTVKYYENLKVVYQIQTLLRDWQQQAEDPKAGKSSEPKTDDRKLPVKAVQPGGAPASNPSGASH